MTRRGFAALLLLALLALAPGCGKYGPPVRSTPTDDARVAERPQEEPVSEASPGADDEAQAEAPDDSSDDAAEKAPEETPQ